MVKRIAVLMVLVFLILCSCKDKKNVFTVDQNRVSVKTGDEFILKIISNHSTGYKWMEETTIDTQFLQLKLVDYIINNKNTDGGGGYEYWHFKALNKGETVVKLKYVQPFEDLPPDKMVNFKIIIE